MTPAEIDITIYQGATFRKPFQWLTGTPAVPVDLTGGTARMQIRRNISADTPEITLTTETSGITLTNAANGEFAIHLTPEQTAGLDIRKGVYDIELVVGGDTHRVVMGTVEVSKEVTRT
jgi:hypothetical protein